jgi:predicted metal-binding protein
MSATKMRDMMTAPISDWSLTLAEVMHQADLVTFKMQAATQFEAMNPEAAEKYKKGAMQKMTALRKAVKKLGDEVKAL